MAPYHTDGGDANNLFDLLERLRAERFKAFDASPYPSVFNVGLTRLWRLANARANVDDVAYVCSAMVARHVGRNWRRHFARMLHTLEEHGLVKVRGAGRCPCGGHFHWVQVFPPRPALVEIVEPEQIIVARSARALMKFLPVPYVSDAFGRAIILN